MERSDPETKWQEFFRCAGATIILIVLGAVASPFIVIFIAVWLAWTAVSWVEMAFSDLLEDETHLDKIKKQMKGEG